MGGKETTRVVHAGMEEMSPYVLMGLEIGMRVLAVMRDDDVWYSCVMMMDLYTRIKATQHVVGLSLWI